MDQRLISDRFPRASRYHPDWVLAAVSGAANPLWLTEWLAEAMDLRPGMRVLDLGCGRALSSVFLRREFGVQVWATDLWFSAEENIERVRDAGVEDGVFPGRADARSLPFSEGFFDAIVSVDAFMYFGTDDLYLNYLARFVRPGGQIGIALAGFLKEIDEPVPAHLAEWWVVDRPNGLHSVGWWRRHWERSGIVDVAVADTLPDGWRLWRDWVKLIAPANEKEISALEEDAGRYFGYVRAVGRRRADVQLFDPFTKIPGQYTKQPLLREEAKPSATDMLVIEAGDTDQSFALAATTLAAGRSVVVFDGTLVLRPARGELLCEVVDPAPSSRRCANEYEVLVENAQRAFEASKLHALLPRLRRKWLVVGDTGAGTTELWPAT